jgi:hypothetical protein
MDIMGEVFPDVDVGTNIRAPGLRLPSVICAR